MVVTWKLSFERGECQRTHRWEGRARRKKPSECEQIALSGVTASWVERGWGHGL